LNRDDINPEQGEFSVRGKGDKIRLVFLSHTAKQSLKNYLEKRTDNEQALFVNKNNQRLTNRSIQRITKFYSKKAGITKKVTPHLLRHQFATDLLSSGADIRSVQALLGHASINSTQIYTHITNRDLRDIHSAFHGKQRPKD
jgi:site-specific recombinase XerD